MSCHCCCCCVAEPVQFVLILTNHPNQRKIASGQFVGTVQRTLTVWIWLFAARSLVFIFISSFVRKKNIKIICERTTSNIPFHFTFAKRQKSKSTMSLMALSQSVSQSEWLLSVSWTADNFYSLFFYAMRWWNRMNKNWTWLFCLFTNWKF